MKFPHKLLPGATVGVIAPCSPVSETQLAGCLEGIEKLGYKVKLADNLTEKIGGYMAGTGRARGEWINRMFEDESVDGILCIRGGDSGTRAVPYVDLDTVRKNPKPFIGYSDVTSFHILFNQECGLVTFHGPMGVSMNGGFDGYSEKSLLDCLNGDGIYELKAPEGMEYGSLYGGSASGTVIGGNLSLLSAAMGTPYEPDTRGKILFIEEVCEPITKIEKWACQLRNSGKLRDCAGILLGEFTKMEYRTDYTELNIFSELCEDLKIPVMYGLQCGHDKHNATIPMGAVCHMDAAAKSVVFEIKR